MRFLVDVGVSKKVEKWLAENGYDAKAVRDIDPKAKDSEILHFWCLDYSFYWVSTFKF